MAVLEQKGKQITIRLRSRRLKYFFKREISNAKLDLLFSSIKSAGLLRNEFEITFFELFALEVYVLLDWVIKDDKSEFGKDLVDLNRALTLLKTKTWVRNVFGNVGAVEDKLDYKQIKKLMKFKILPHQQEAFNYYNKAKANLGYMGGMLDMSVGSGKTFTSLAIAETIHSDVIIVVCPLPTLYRVWRDSIENTIYKKPQANCVLKTDTYKKEKFILCHYESLNKLQEIIHKVKGKVTFIIDESHNFSDPKSDRTKLLKNIIAESDTEDVIMMSGTPIKATAREVINIMDILDPKFKTHARDRFIKLYKGMGALLNSTLATRYRAYSVKITKESFSIPTLTTYKVNMSINDSDKYLITNIRKDVKKYAEERMAYFEKNKEHYKDIYLNLYNKAKEEAISYGVHESLFKEYENDIEVILVLYKEKRLFDESERLERVNNFEKKVLNTYLYGEDKKLFKEAKTVYKYVALKILGETLSNVIGKARENCHVDMVKELTFKDIINTTTSKTLIFTKYVNVADAVIDKVTKEKYTPLKVYGKDTKALSKTVRDFGEDDKLNPLVATYKSLSTGVPLIMANVMISCDLPYRAYELEQTIARIARIGQTKSCYFYYLVLDTGEELNINSRNIDINKLNNEAVAEITGYKNQEYLEDSEENTIDLTIEDKLLINKVVRIKDNFIDILTLNDKKKFLKNIF